MEPKEEGGFDWLLRWPRPLEWVGIAIVAVALLVQFGWVPVPLGQDITVRGGITFLLFGVAYVLLLLDLRGRGDTERLPLLTGLTLLFFLLGFDALGVLGPWTLARWLGAGFVLQMVALGVGYTVLFAVAVAAGLVYEQRRSRAVEAAGGATRPGQRSG